MATKTSPAFTAFTGKCILITGAGGFIGAALTAALAESDPRLLVLLDHSEQNLHQLHLALRERGFSDYVLVLGDVCDAALLQEVLVRYRPENIFHAAACKHVPLMEGNPLAAMRTNALGTWRLVNAAAQGAVQSLLLISTDKAVNPASVMGATKRVAELALERMAGGGLALQSVRLGNVHGSRGSVVPLFARQIAQGGPVTVTHPEAERYFFTLDETVRIILRAATLGPGTFIPKLPPPLKIAELARRMILAHGNPAEPPVTLQITKMRPGDKLREEFLNKSEAAEVTQDDQLLRVRGPLPDAECFDAAMWRLEEFVEQRNLRAALETLCHLVPDYHPSQALLELLHEPSVTKA